MITEAEQIEKLQGQLAWLQGRLVEEQRERRRYQQYVDSLIAMAPVELRRHVVSRLGGEPGKVTTYMDGGLWDLIMSATAAQAERTAP